MRRLFQLGYNHCYITIGVTFLLTALFAPHARNLEIDVSTDALTSPHSPLRKEYEIVRTDFGSDQAIIIYAADAALFQSARLKKLKDLNDRFSMLPYVERVGSLFTLPDIRYVDGFLETAPLLQSIPTDSTQVEEKKRQALENPILRRNLISTDGNATQLILYLDLNKYPDLNAREIFGEIEEILEAYQNDFTELYQVGGPAIENWMTDLLRTDQIYILPIAFIVLVTLLAITLRSFIGAILPVINAVIAISWTLGLMAMLGIPLTLLNYILPVLILVIGATEDVHIFHEFRKQIKESGDGSEAIEKTGQRISIALILTALTTILGFASTILSELPILRFFGLAAIIGMTARFLVSFFFLPACLRLLQNRIAGNLPREKSFALISDSTARSIATFIMRRIVPYPRVVWGLIVITVVPSLFLASKINLNNDLISFLNPESLVVKKVDTVAEQLTGYKTIYLTLYGTSGDYLSPTALRELSEITQYLNSLAECDSAISFADIISRINEQIHEGDPEHNTIPNRAATIEQILLFSHPKDFKAYVSPDYARANIIIRCNINDSARLNSFIEGIKSEIDDNRFGPQIYTITGNATLVASAVDSITLTQILSLGSMGVILCIIVSTLFVSFRCGLITVVSNLFSITLISGIMGLFDIPLNVGTCMVAAITLGLAIDDTLHLLVRYSIELKSLKDEHLGIESSLREEINPILATSIALAGGFIVLIFSSFEPVRQFGLLSAGVILLALIADLILTPVLITTVRLITLWDLLGLNLRRVLLEKSPLLKDLTHWQAKKIILASDVEEYKAGEVIIRKGNIGDKLYLVIAGELEVSIHTKGEKVSVNPIHLGEIFGEISLVTQVRRTADVIALTDTRLLSLNAESFNRLRKFSPFLSSHLFLNLTHILALRLAERNK